MDPTTINALLFIGLPVAAFGLGYLGGRPLNICTRRVGGLRFVKIGRLCLSFCVTREYRAL